MDQSGPVTVIIRHWVRPGKEAEFEDWLRGITQGASKFDGTSAGPRGQPEIIASTPATVAFLPPGG
jgi:antibiotic biosynthesis monooxygenase (ABM) superfamily enzyme